MSWMVKFVEWPHQIKNNNNTDLRNTLTRNFFNAKLWLLVRSQAGSWLKILLLSTVHTRCLITFISLDTPVYHLPAVYVLTQPLLFKNSYLINEFWCVFPNMPPTFFLFPEMPQVASGIYQIQQYKFASMRGCMMRPRVFCMLILFFEFQCSFLDSIISCFVLTPKTIW